MPNVPVAQSIIAAVENPLHLIHTIRETNTNQINGEKTMKTKLMALTLTCGVLLGFLVAAGLGAMEKPKDLPKKDWSRLQIVAYPNGGTGFFDPDSGTLYVYDSELRQCYLVRQLINLGDPTVRP